MKHTSPQVRHPNSGPVFAVVLVCLLVLSLGTASPSWAQSPQYQLVGFSQATASGDSGVLLLNTICYTEFPGSRMCKSDELVTSVHPPLTATQEYAWVHTTAVASSDYYNSLFDATGKLMAFDQGVAFNCDGWSYANTISIAITTDTGAAYMHWCGEMLRIACCAPTQADRHIPDAPDQRQTAPAP